MKQILKTIILIMPILMAMKAFGQHKNQFKMEQKNREERIVSEQVAVIDKISIPQKAIAAYAEKSLFIRNTLRQQPGFVKYEIFQQTDDSGDLQVITVATWEHRQRMEDASVVIREAMQRAGINLPAFLAQHAITMERGIYQTVEE
ncbi:antibiotic biosynthesis monooxygenase [Chitinophaga pollutisoli]|uniref:Antibiotic biosynthesis monooxygenase n=1 Tax=Chitinophaga pollutisoli TaxID=3133966 RepID=A0ABZ2YQR0_9BACT